MKTIYQFTYKDYIKYIHNIKQKDYLDLQEEEEKYELFVENHNIINCQQIIENLFKDKKRIYEFLNCFLEENEKIEEENLILFDFIKNFKSLKILYKHIKKNFFYLIIYEKEISINLPYQILQECIKVINSRTQKNYQKLVIIPIVIYAENNLLYHNRRIRKCFKVSTYDKNILELKYNLINIFNLANQPKIRDTIIEDLLYMQIY